ncbi:MAG: D-alanyl-D-alanine carboxypeptidase [Cyclobacteriaceae bacterium]
MEHLSFETDKPFITSANLTKNLLQEALGRQITLIDDKGFSSLPHQKLPTTPADSIYAQMMKISDNFLAEQLIVMVSDQLFDSLNMSAAIKYAKDSLLNDLPDEPQWVDGSGLSPQNMFTPRSVVKLLEKIRNEVPMQKIKAYFPVGGESGTIRNWYPADPGDPAYIYAKTGTLSMSSALSGYLITKSGKTLIFSTFFNNYTGSSNVQKEELQKVLYFIHQNY